MRNPTVQNIVGVGSIALGVFLMLGWILRVPLMVQPHPGHTVVVFNTALCFAFAGLGIVLFSVGSRRAAQLRTLLGCAIVALTALVLVQGLTGTRLGIDWPSLHGWMTAGAPVRREVLGDTEYEARRIHVESALRGEAATTERRETTQDGGVSCIEVSYVPDFDESNKIAGFYTFGHDITDRKLNEERLEAMALHDPLTGLANRRLLVDRVSLAIAHARRGTTAMAVLYLDLDGFKQVNDTQGHDAGDALLTSVAQRLLAAVREEDTVARLGGDEFAIGLWHVSGAAAASGVAEKVVGIVSQPYDVGGRTVDITVSAGVAVYPQHGSDAATLLNRADVAMYAAKNAGRNGYRVFDGRGSEQPAAI